jgi:RHH-type proline utilization regulon transcriptional repressor/proline dehydrogenase/delta 1-pyrroline-5-carboxylate dehydrogenase
MSIDEAKLEQNILKLGTDIFNDVQNHSLSVFDPQFYSGKLMDWAMEDEEFKISLFRFVDVLPSLTSSTDVIQHAQEYFKPVQHRIPGLLKWGLNLDPNSIPAKVAAQVIRKQIRSMAEQFILGETPKQALKSLRKIRQDGMAFTVDLLGEAVVSEVEAQEFTNRYLELLDALAKEVPSWPESAPLIAGHRGEETPLNISVKPSALYSQAKTVSTERTVDILAERLSPLLIKAKKVGAYVYIDMEDSSFTSITIDTLKKVLSHPELKDFPGCAIVLQAYLRRTEQDLAELIDWSKKRGVPIGVRLVKGAYWDTETILATQHGWPIPVWQEKAGSDSCYERLSRMLLDNADIVAPAFASHNIRSLCHAVEYAKLIGLEQSEIEIQALYGMAEPIKKTFTDRGYLVRDYAPIGKLLPGMGYLVRRLLENTSNEGFLRQSFRENESPEILLRKPETLGDDTGTEHLDSEANITFVNEPLTDFSLTPKRRGLQGALDSVTQSLRESPALVRPVINGEFVETEKSIESISPEDTSFRLATIGLASIAQAEQAIESLTDYFPTWRSTHIENRCQVLNNAAEIMQERKEELSALIVLESGKQWEEADGDVAEAIDFLNFYAQEAAKLFTKKRLGDYPGEENHLFYEPRGACLVISPWNFPLAIPCGMFAAALVTGNCPILKPAEQTSLIAARLFQIFVDAGMPDAAASFLPGLGEEVGKHLVRHKNVATIVFTGSKEVGLDIVKAGAEVSQGQEHVKRVIAEMGGKNAIIIDAGADLDEAVKGVVHSAFGFQGQKCSACSRVIVLESVYDNFVERLKSATESIVVAPSSRPESFVGPVIDEEAHQRILKLIEQFRSECDVLAEGAEPPKDSPLGYYVRPTVFGNVSEDHEILSTEIFGPVLAVVKAKDFQSAINIALDSEYGLTGGLFSRSPENIRLATQEFRVGNLYLNRGCTGAMVYRQPFGGAKMSGVGSKAGGPDYLLQFVIPRAISENTMRRGFAPM